MNDPEDKKGKPESKPGVTPGSGRPHPEVAPEQKRSTGTGPGTITEVAPEPQQRGGPIKEVAPEVGRGIGPIKEMAPDVARGVHPEVAPDMRQSHGPIYQPMYAHTIHNVVAEGHLPRMRQVAQEAEQQLNQFGDLRTALEILRTEIAKLEHKHKS